MNRISNLVSGHDFLGRATAFAAVAFIAGALNSQAQPQPPGCTPGGLGALISITTPSGQPFAHVGDSITITRVAANLSVTGCNLTNGNFWTTYPSGGTTQSMAGFVLTPGGEIQCVQAPANAACIAFPTSYTIKAPDVGRNLSFTMPKGNACVRPGAPKTVFFMVSDEADLLGASLTASGCGNVAVEILTPGIACVKNCVNGVGQNGQITFSGFVTNTGDTVLFSVSVSNLVNGTLSLLTNIAQLNVGARVNFGGSYTPANPCVPTTDTIFVRGTDIANLTVTSQCTATCSNVLTPCIVVTKDCNTVGFGQANTVSGIVTNCGNVTITNIQVTDNLYGAITNFASLAPGASAAYSKLVTNANCGNFPNTVTATARTICGQQIQDTDTDVCVVTCQPQICVTKEVVCELPTGCANNWSKLAIGVRNGDDCPSFCYRIRVTNCGQENLQNVTVTDPNLSLAGCNFPTTLAIGQTVECIIAGVERCNDLTNTVEAVGVGVGSGIRTNDTDFAEIKVREISITCEATVNGQPFIQIPCDGQPHVVTNAVRVCNTGDLPLTNISIFAPNLIALGGACADVANLRFSLGVGECTNIVLCVDAPACEPDCGIAFSNFVHIVAHVDLSKTNVCIWTRNATNGIVEITAETECLAEVGCEQPNACRVTGGGRQDADLLTCPDDVRYVTHGGQVGAPVGERTCEIDTALPNWILGNPCIHGRWTHVRHEQGGLRGNFHARYYDTLECACLATNLGSNCQYGPGQFGEPTKKHEVCNPGDKVAGPEPRKSPSNKIAFTGVGDWACPNGRRAPRACLFRVDIEDRSEPGGSHPKGGTDPADRYRIRIWVLTPQELAQLRNPNDGLLAFRNAIAACKGIDYLDGGAVSSNGKACIENNCSGDICDGTGATGTITFPGGTPVRTPNIDDGGELERGNHQIHPSIKNCDPANPTGPGLPGRL